METNRIKKIFVEICRVLLGIVFVFSGFVKAVDPWGSVYKSMDYFTAFQFDVPDSFAVLFAFVQIALEFALGVCLLIGVYRRYASYLALLFMIAMTPLTLYLAIANPVTDCGCFGDALVITNWQTFYKNVVLLAAAIFLVVGKNYRLITPFFTQKSYSLALLWITLFVVGFSLYNFTYLPMLDFRPYKIGADIPKLMEFPENAELPVYETTLIYEKEGKQQKFTINNYPKGDGWTFVDSKSVLVKKGYEPPIHGFNIANENEDDITEEILSDPSYSFLLIAHKLEKANDSNVDKINEIHDFAKSNGYKFQALTASLPEEIKEWKDNTGAEYSCYTADDIALKTIIRSNPGLLLLKQGIIINKWPNSRLPDSSQLTKPLEESALGSIPVQHHALKIALSALILIVPLLLLFGYDFFYLRKNQKSIVQKRNMQSKTD
jgi:uncharacterized membrane protein YphA (DoxX/SURF4 family)